MTYDPGEAIGRLERRNPAAVLLAEAASLAAIVDPALCRDLRTTLTAGGPETEADLYFSEIVRDRSPVGFMIDTQAAAILRERLASDPERLATTWQLISARHGSISQAIEVEEQLQFHAIRGDFDRVREILRECVAALIDPARMSFSAWAIDAIDRLDPRVRDFDEYRMLGIGAAMRTGAPDGTIARLADDRLEDWLAWLAPKAEQKYDIGVQMVEGGIEFGPAAQQRYEHRIAVAGPLPALVTVRSSSGETRHARLREDRRLLVALEGTSFVISTAEGSRWQVRPPVAARKSRDRARVEISYDVESEGRQLKESLPFVVGVMGDFSGNAGATLKSLADRRFVALTYENFDQVMARIEPGVQLLVDDVLAGEKGRKLSVSLEFRSMGDFEPGRIVKQIAPLRELLKVRNQLRELMAKADSSEQLEILLEQMLSDPSAIGEARAQFAEPNRAKRPPKAESPPALTPTKSEPPPRLLDQAMAATRQTDSGRMQELLQTLVSAASDMTVQFDKNLTVTLRNAIANLDERLSAQLSLILHHEQFLEIEGRWRGLHYLVRNTEIGESLRIRVLNVGKGELALDLRETVWNESESFAKIYADEIGSAGGHPYGLLICDYSFDHSTEDMKLLRGLAKIAEAAKAPLFAAASPHLFEFESFNELGSVSSLEKRFQGHQYADWHGLRQSPESQYVVLTLPRVLARTPYGRDTRRIEEFNFEEVLRDGGGYPLAMEHDHYCWMSSAYALGTRVTAAFAQYDWCTAIRGAEGGGKVENLPTHIFSTDDGDIDSKCPTEIAVWIRREAELSKLGFSPLCHYKNADYAVFFEASSLHHPKEYTNPGATADAAIAARLPFRFAACRFVQYLTIMARDKIGSFMEAEDCEYWLQNWLGGYVNASEFAGQETQARFPLRSASIQIHADPERIGLYRGELFIQPWFESEALSAPIRVPFDIPGIG